MLRVISSLCSAFVATLIIVSTSAYAANFPSHRDTHGNRVFIFSPKTHTWAAYDANGRRVNQGYASGGKEYCPDLRRGCRTIVGSYTIIAKKGPGCKSSKFPKPRGGAPMPYCMFFHPKGYAIHGSPDVPRANASHGCIRVTPDMAKWLSHHFITVGTKVIVLPYH